MSRQAGDISKCLIIIRGPTGIGKSAVSKALMKRLGINRTEPMNLDQIQIHLFEPDIKSWLEEKNAVAEMYFGDSHTTNPEEWLNRFRQKGFKVLSVVLEANLETCFERVKTRSQHTFRTLDEYKLHYDGFQYIQKNNLFNSKAKVKEVLINTEKRTVESIVEQILDELKKGN